MIALLAFLAFGLVACSNTEWAADDSIGDSRSFVELTDSISLAENDEFYLGSPADVALDGQGRIYLSDTYSESVIQFSKSGQPLRRFGHKGKGPGELSAAFALLVLGDSLLVVSDAVSQKLVFFDLQSGAMRREVLQVGVVTSIDTVPGGLVLGRMDLRSKTSAALLRSEAGTIEPFGPVPAEQLASPNIAAWLPFSVVAPMGEDIMVSAMGSSNLYQLNADRELRDSLSLPVRLRRGVPKDIVEQFNKESSLEDKALISSALIRARSLSDGWLGLVHMDYKLDGNDVTARTFLSVLHWKNHKACVDREVVLAGHGRPVAGVFGGSFVVVEQVVTGGVRPTTTVRFFTPDYDLCRKQAVSVSEILPSPRWDQPFAATPAPRPVPTRRQSAQPRRSVHTD